jgi:hypothetical protein
MKKHLRMFVVLAVCVLALGVRAAVYGQNNQDQNNQDSAVPGSYLTTITDAKTGAFASRSVITLHTDHTLTVIDSNQEGSAFPPFSSQQGTWATSPSDRVVARTINWSFPFATEGTARLDYNFTTVHTNQLSGTITLTFFPPSGNPLDGGGTEAGTFNFTGVRITVP